MSLDVTVESAQSFLDCADEWNRLVCEMAYPTPFATWAWMVSWIEHFGAGRQVRLLMVRDGGRLCAILPFVETGSTARFHGLAGRGFEYLGVESVYPDHLDLIVAPTHASACCEALIEHLDGSEVGCDTLRLPMVTEDSALFRSFAHSLAGWRTRVVEAARAPYLPIAGSYEDYLGTLSRNQRYKLRSYCRKLLDGEGVEYRRIEPAEQAGALDRLFELHENRANAKSMASSFSGPTVHAFHRSLIGRLSPDQVLLRSLTLGDRTIAILYGFRVGNRLFYFQLGHDPDWAAFSPGTVIIAKTICEAFESGCSEFNFLQGDEAYKATWTRQFRNLFEIRLYRATLPGNAAHLLGWIKGGVRRLLRH